MRALGSRLALIGGTSSCHMAVSPEPRFIRGIWGPYHSAMISGLWLIEGGQSATGALIDHVIFSHAATPQLRREARRSGGRFSSSASSLGGQSAAGAMAGGYAQREALGAMLMPALNRADRRDNLTSSSGVRYGVAGPVRAT